MNKRHTFNGSIGFVLAAAGSAVGLGNIWRFPYLAAKGGGGLFVAVYIILALTFGFSLLTAEIAIGRKTRQSPLTAYSSLKKGWKFLGILSCLVPIIIFPYYCVIGGWVLKYLIVFIIGKGNAAAADGYFSGFITSQWEPIIMFAIFLLAVAFIIFRGVNKGIEASSKIIMPALVVLVLAISIFSLTLTHTETITEETPVEAQATAEDATASDAALATETLPQESSESTDSSANTTQIQQKTVTRTGLQGLGVYLIPNFDGLTVKDFFAILMNAMGQLFYSLSIAMGIMIAYGSYVSDDSNLVQSINRIEIFDTAVAILAGVMIIPAVYTFMGNEGMKAGPGLMFVVLPKVFSSMGIIGNLIGALFFIMVLFAALSSAVSVMEAIVSSLMDEFHISRTKALNLEGILGLIAGIIVCLGYNILYFEYKLPSGDIGQVLDIMDYVSNNILMPIVAIVTCIFVGYVIKTKTITDEITKNGEGFSRKIVFEVMIKFIAPALLFILFLKSAGIVTII